jgi:hypothetical protein
MAPYYDSWCCKASCSHEMFCFLCSETYDNRVSLKKTCHELACDDTMFQREFTECCTRLKYSAVILWDIAQCSPHVSRRFGGKWHLHLQCRKWAEQETRVQQVAKYVSEESGTSIFSVENEPNKKPGCSRWLSTFRRKVSPPSSVSKMSRTRNQGAAGG